MTISFKESILYYDCELILEAEDDAGRRYIAVHDGACQNGCHYMVVPTDLEAIDAFKAGTIGLNELLTAAPDGRWYTTEPGDNPDGIILHLQPTPITDHVSSTDIDYFVRRATDPSEP